MGNRHLDSLNSVCMHTSSMWSPSTKHGFVSKSFLGFCLFRGCYCKRKTHTLMRAPSRAVESVPHLTAERFSGNRGAASNLPSLKQPAVRSLVISRVHFQKHNHWVLLRGFTTLATASHTPAAGHSGPGLSEIPQSSPLLCTEDSVSWDVDHTRCPLYICISGLSDHMMSSVYLCDLFMTTVMYLV